MGAGSGIQSVGKWKWAGRDDLVVLVDAARVTCKAGCMDLIGGLAKNSWPLCSLPHSILPPHLT